MKGMYLLNWKTHRNAPEVHGILFGNTATYQSSMTKCFIHQGKRDSVLLFFPLCRAVPINK